MDPLHLERLRSTYGWPPDTTFSLPQEGENTTYLVTTGSDKYVLRKYRPGRYSRIQIEGELAWMDALHGAIAVPAVMPNSQGQLTASMPDQTGEQLYAAFAFVDGVEPEQTDADVCRRLGAVVRRMHDGSDQILAVASPDWAGRSRPVYDRSTLVEQPLTQLLAATFLPPDVRGWAQRAAELMLPRMESLRTGFVHNDLHAGNLLRSGDDLVCLDFDECGFGPRALDLGVIRMHLVARNQAAELWPEGVSGYGHGEPDEAHLGTALRTFWMAGKVLGRPDVVPDPEIRIPRYLGWVESELALLG